MGFKLAEGYVELGTKGYDQAEKKIDGLVGKFKQSLKNVDAIGAGIGGAIGGVIASAMQRAISAVEHGIRSMVELAAQADMTAGEFNVLTGNAELTRDVLLQIEEAFSGTRIDVSRGVLAAQRLMFAGMAPEQAVETVKRLGAVAAGSGDDIIRMSTAYQKALARGELSGEILEAMPAVVEELKTMFPELGENIYDAASQGLVGIDKLDAAIERLATRGGKFLKAQKDSLAGQWDLMKGSLFDEHGGLVTNLVGGLMEAVAAKENLAAITKLIQEFGGLAKEVGDFVPVVETLHSIFAAFGDAIYMTSEALAFLAEGVNDVAQGVQEDYEFVAQGFNEVGDNILELIDDLAGSSLLDRYGTPAMLRDEEAAKVAKEAEKAARVRGAGGMPGAPQFISLTALAEKMQMEAGKNLEANIADATERTAAATEEIAEAVKQGTAVERPNLGARLGLQLGMFWGE